MLRKGRQHCLVLKPAVQRIDEAEDLAEVVREYETQLAANRWGREGDGTAPERSPCAQPAAQASGTKPVVAVKQNGSG